MGYREFQRRHPEFPKRMIELEGKIVRLNRDIETRAGDKFSKGELMKVYSVSVGSLHLTRADGKGFIRRVHPSAVNIEGTMTYNEKIRTCFEAVARKNKRKKIHGASASEVTAEMAKRKWLAPGDTTIDIADLMQQGVQYDEHR